MIQFYLPDISENLTLPEAESGHCVRVLRMKKGDELICVDGKGCRYTCVITDAHPKHVALEIRNREVLPNHWPCKITLAVAPTKNVDRMEWLFEKCTEMGIDEIIPLKTTHSERKALRHDRMEKILVSAMKQSLKTVLPHLRELTEISEVMKADLPGQKFICYCGEDVERRELVKEYQPGSDVTILIGPEGDFSPQEVRLALQQGWLPVSLGNSRLRTETAGMYAVAAIHAINNRELQP